MTKEVLNKSYEFEIIVAHNGFILEADHMLFVYKTLPELYKHLDSVFTTKEIKITPSDPKKTLAPNGLPYLAVGQRWLAKDETQIIEIVQTDEQDDSAMSTLGFWYFNDKPDSEHCITKTSLQRLRLLSHGEST